MSRLGAFEDYFFYMLFGLPILAAVLFIIVVIIFLKTDRESPKKIKRMTAARVFGIIAGVLNLSILVMFFAVLGFMLDIGLNLILFVIPLLTAAAFIITLIILKRTDKTSPEWQERKIAAMVIGAIAGVRVFAVSTILSVFFLLF